MDLKELNIRIVLGEWYIIPRKFYKEYRWLNQTTICFLCFRIDIKIDMTEPNDVV